MDMMTTFLTLGSALFAVVGIALTIKTLYMLYRKYCIWDALDNQIAAFTLVVIAILLATVARG